VPKKGEAVKQYGGGSGTVSGLVLPEESVDSAVRRIQASVQDTVQAIDLIDKCMAQLRSDPYYKVLEMRYFEGRTQEDIAYEFGCSQVNISKNKSRLVRELSMRLFPNQVVGELLN
jgi:RNA polymerase sigma factor (sigma-70 family)